MKKQYMSDVCVLFSKCLWKKLSYEIDMSSKVKNHLPC